MARSQILALIGFILSFPVCASADEPVLTAEALFDPGHIVRVDIEVPEADWDELRAQTRSFADSLGKTIVESPFTYVKGHVTVDGVRIENVGIRKKGFIGSLDKKRPSLKIKFSEYEKQDPIDGLDRLTLNNNKQDPSNLMQVLAYQLFNDSSTKAPRCNYAQVTVNGRPLGIYSHVESIRKPFLKRTFGDSSGELFEGTVTDFFDDWMQKFETKNKRSKLSTLEKLRAVLEKEELRYDEINEVLDVRAFVRFWAMESLISFWDGYNNNQNNYFVYQNPETSKLHFIPWGIDSAFTETMPLPPFIISPKSVHSQSVLANRLFKLPEVQKLYRETMTTFLEEHWQEDKVLANIDRLEELLSEHKREDTKFSNAVQKLRSFVQSRRKSLMKELDAWPVKMKPEPRTPPYFTEMGTARATFSTKWFEESPENPLVQGDVEIEMILNGEEVKFSQIGAVAEWSKFPSPDGERPPSIALTGKTAAEGEVIVLGIGLDAADFEPSKTSVDVFGIFFGAGQRGMIMISGTTTLEAAATELDSEVKGKLDVKILQLSGGE
jgi:spore coat protein CotH